MRARHPAAGGPWGPACRLELLAAVADPACRHPPPLVAVTQSGDGQCCAHARIALPAARAAVPYGRNEGEIYIYVNCTCARVVQDSVITYMIP